jgi:hypothetical protein
MGDGTELLVRQGRGGRIAAVVFLFIVLVWTPLAVRNLTDREAMIPSALWIALVTITVVSRIREHGLRGYGRSLLNGFARRQLLCVERHGQSRTLAVGFRLLGRNFIEQRVPVQDVASLTSSSGQASDRAGRDVGDWTVFLWYRHHDSRREERELRSRYKRPGLAILGIGPARAKQGTESLGLQVANFLNASGSPVVVEATPPSPAARLLTQPTGGRWKGQSRSSKPPGT